MLQKHQQAFAKAGFVQKSVELRSGEFVPYFEREATGEVQHVCLFAHGMTASALT